MGVDQLTKDPSSSGQKDLLSKAEGFILPNHDTGRILLAESQRNTIETDPSVVVTNSSANEGDEFLLISNKYGTSKGDQRIDLYIMEENEKARGTNMETENNGGEDVRLNYSKDASLDIIGIQETKCGVVDDMWVEDIWGGRGFRFTQLAATRNIRRN
ncbi:hypothetical protein Tco_1492045 [Tanacetum coccineum]